MQTKETKPNEQTNTEPPESNQEKRGFVADIILNSIEPGVNNSVLIFLNIVFVLLLATLAAVSVFTGLNIHVIFLGIIALGLMIGFNLFISQLPAGNDEIGKDKSDQTANSPVSINTRTKQD